MAEIVSGIEISHSPLLNSAAAGAGRCAGVAPWKYVDSA
jgi:hypothetical protein